MDTAVDNQIIVEDVVSALTGSAENTSSDDLRTQMERATAEFDKRTADAFGRALLDSLTDDPGNLRQLEALLILGLAHPDVLNKNRISLAVEGRRLAVLLERSGEVDRARGVLELLANRLPEERTIDHELAGILRRSGNTDELVERYMRRAERAVEDGNIAEAIPWLQEILLLDRTRRDVARMIRDLRYQEADRDARNSRRARVLFFILVFSAVCTAVLGREWRIHREYESIVAADPENPNTLYQRKAMIEDLIADRRIWVGLFKATAERDALREQIGRFERDKEVSTEKEATERERVQQLAEAARLRGLMYSERGEFERALTSFKKSLALAPTDWDHRDRLVTDIAALENWKAENPQ